mmetsp:Transcript_11070/g.23448  ORF Transcript_11070/g.23448 Transcript_11070/m.23448 type:complete len:292 (+) Transcript_11070:144-1019(+)
MCKPTATQSAEPTPTTFVAKSSVSSPSSSLRKNAKNASGGRTTIANVAAPLHPSVAAVAMAAFVPSWFYVNRGFTVWFHLASFFQLLTQSRFMVKALTLCGTSVCLGWYASLVYEYAQHGRCFDALYKNMPSALTEQMLVWDTTAAAGGKSSENGTLDFESASSLAAMAVSHVLDFLGHPLLTYYYWIQYRRETTKRNNDGDEDDSKQASSKENGDDDILAWPVIFSAYGYSRIWSIVHNYHNYGSFGLFYFGFDVYVLDALDAWYPAYIAETLFYASLVLWKLRSILRSR